MKFECLISVEVITKDKIITKNMVMRDIFYILDVESKHLKINVKDISEKNKKAS